MHARLILGTQEYQNNLHQPVMVWIYGGGFISADNTFAKYGPEPLFRTHVKNVRKSEA